MFLIEHILLPSSHLDLSSPVLMNFFQLDVSFSFETNPYGTCPVSRCWLGY